MIQAEKLVKMRNMMLMQVSDALENCTAFKIAINRAAAEVVPAKPEDAARGFKTFEPGPETIFTIKVRHDADPPSDYVFNPPKDSLQGVPALAIAETVGPGESVSGESTEVKPIAP